MARRKQNEEMNQDFDNIFEGLAQGTGFILGDKSQVLTSRNKVRTPIEALNCVLGGGLPFGTVAQSYGPPKVGKSTWMYQMMGNFQRQYPNGVCAIVDMEASADSQRISFLGVDMSKVLVLPATSIESGFLALMKMLDNKKKNDNLRDVPVFVIWDTISKGLAQDGSTQSRMNAMDRARVIKNYMSPMLGEIEKQDFILCLLNQVIYKVDNYGNVKMDSGGGVALKHDVHFSTKITSASDEWEGNFLVKRISRIDIDKSKIGPEVGNVPMVIDIKEGGKIDEISSFIDYFEWLGWITQSSGWYHWTDLVKREEMNPFFKILCDYNNKKYRKWDLVSLVKDNLDLYHTFRYTYMRYLSEMYKLQANVMQDYMQDCEDELKQYYYPAELRVVQDDIYRETVKHKLVEDSELFDKVESAVASDCKAICLDCGTPKHDLYGCDACGSGCIVSKEVAKSLIDDILANKVYASDDIEVGGLDDGTEVK